MLKTRKFFSYKTVIHLFFILLSLVFILPFVLIVSISFSEESDVLRYGYSLIPRNFTTTAYTYVFSNMTSLLDAYKVTIINSVVSTAISVIMMALTGYALSRENFAYKKFVNAFLVVTMFFSGGLIPSYVINTRVFHLENSPFIYLFYNLVSAYTIFVFRTFFAQIPKSLVESATLDGASELQILTRITLPLSKPVIATFSFMGMITRWNQFEPSLYYIRDKSLYTLQFLLQQVLNEAEFLKQAMKEMPEAMTNVALPSETLKFAICVLAAGPMICVFPFFQKYFSKGMVVGAVKG
ncbi:MAG: carbohydrate ABC transporter permease [Acutalibacteraceae bacterium]